MLLFRSPRRGDSKNQLIERFARFVHFDWIGLLFQSSGGEKEEVTRHLAVAQCCRKTTQSNGEQSGGNGRDLFGRAALECAPCAPGNPAHLLHRQPEATIELDRGKFFFL